MKTPQVLPANEVTPKKRRAPYRVILDAVNEGRDEPYLIVTEVAEHLGVHAETVRRLTKAYNADGTKKVNAPSMATQQGDMVIYLFTPEDVQELEDYFTDKTKPKAV